MRVGLMTFIYEVVEWNRRSGTTDTGGWDKEVPTSVPVAERTPLFSPLRYLSSVVLMAIRELPRSSNWYPVASPTSPAHIT